MAEQDAGDEAADLAREQTDPERLMDGENPESDEPEDARHWLGVYQELYAFKSDVLAKLRTRRTEMNSSAAHEEVAADEKLLEMELDRFQRRAEFWRRRLQELEGA